MDESNPAEARRQQPRMAPPTASSALPSSSPSPPQLDAAIENSNGPVAAVNAAIAPLAIDIPQADSAPIVGCASTASSTALVAPSSASAPPSELSPCSRQPLVPTVTIKLCAAGHMRRFRVPANSSLEELKREVRDICKFNSANKFNLSYKSGEEDKQIRDDADVVAAFSNALESTSNVSTAAASAKPVRIAVEMIGQVPNASSARLSINRRQGSLTSVAANGAGAAGAASCVSDSAGSSAVALASAAMAMTTVTPLPLNVSSSSSSSASATAAAAVPEVANCMSAMVASVDEVAQRQRASVRVRALLSAPHAIWTLEAIHQQMRVSNEADDTVLLPLVTPAMLSEQMAEVVRQREQQALADPDAVPFNPTPLPPFRPQPLPAPSSSRASLLKWPCAVCTYENVPALRCCQMCAAERPAQPIFAPERVPSPRGIQFAALSPNAPAFEPAPRIPEPVVAAVPSNVSAEPAVAASAVVSPSSAQDPPAASAVEAAAVPVVEAAEPVVPEAVVAAESVPEIAVIAPEAASAAANPSPAAESPAAPLPASSSSNSLAALASPSSGTIPPSPPSPSPMELQLRDQLARLTEQMAQLLAAQQAAAAAAAAGGSPSNSLFASAFGAPVAPSSSSSLSAAPASPSTDSLVAAQLSALVEQQNAKFAEMERSQKALSAQLAEMKQAEVKRKRSGSVKPFTAAGGSSIAKHRQRSLSGVRGGAKRNSAQWGSGSGSLSSSQQSSPASASVPASPQLAAAQPAAAVDSAAAVSAVDSAPPALALPVVSASASATPLTSHSSPSLLVSSLDLSTFVNVLDLESAGWSQPPAAVTHTADRSDQPDLSVPSHPPILSTIHSCGEMEAEGGDTPQRTASEAGAVSDESSTATAAAAELRSSPPSSSSAALTAIPECISASPESPSASSSAVPAAIVASSTSTTSASSSSVDLSMSADLSDDVRFPSLPDVRDREAKLDQIAAMGFTNRIFASTLLDINNGEINSTINALKEFYGQA